MHACAQIPSTITDVNSRSRTRIMSSKFFAYLFASFTIVAAQDLSLLGKRSHHSGPGWNPSHCWETAPGHIKDPFCDLLFQTCATPPTLENGSNKKGYTVTVGSTVSYYCNEGYFLTGPEVITCEGTADGAKWSQGPVCNKVVCPTAPDIANGYHEAINSTEIGTSVQYFCNEGYEILENDTISCVLNETQSSPQWCRPLPECIATCPSIPEIVNGYYAAENSTRLGTTVQYFCNDGFEMLYNDTIACVLNGTEKVPIWTGPVPECIGGCTLPAFTNGVILLPGMEITTITMMPDTTTETVTERQDNTTDVPGASNETDTSNETATTVPDSFNETTTQPNILNASLGLPDILSDTSVDLADSPNDTTAEVSNYTTTALPDTSNDTTTDLPETANETSTDIPDNSNETAVPGTPIPTTTQSPYAYVSNETTFRVNDTIIYQCNAGYGVVSTANAGYVGNMISSQCFLTANKTSMWTTTVVCVPECTPVPEVLNANYTAPANTLQGSSVNYTCFPGFEMVGSSQVTCLPTGNWSELPKCQKCGIEPLDIVFVIDGSGSLGLRSFVQTLQFVVNMVKRFPIETTNFGMLTFSSGTFPQFYLYEYVNDTMGLIERIGNTTYPTGGTKTYDALAFARNDMFQVSNGMRPNVSHLAIVVTDGNSDNVNETVEQAQLLKDAGVTIYSVGVGLTDQNELQLIASSPSYVFTVDNYGRIDEVVGDLARQTCVSTEDTALDEDFVQQ